MEVYTYSIHCWYLKTLINTNAVYSLSETREETVTDRESENFLILTTAMLKLMQIESQLMLGVIPMQHRNKIFEIISRDSFDLLFTDGEVCFVKILFHFLKL